jgi:hypothetical protein
MKTSSILLVLGLAVLLCFSAGAVAQSTIVFSNAPVFGGDPAYGSFGVGIYNGSVNGVGAQFVCDDFLHDITGGDFWSAWQNSTNPVNGGLNDNRFGPATITNPDLTGMGLTQQQEYNMIGYLVTQILTGPSTQWQYLSWAIWSITDGAWESKTVPGSEDNWYTTNVAPLVAAALLNKNTLYNFTVWTPTANIGQEFLQVAESSLTAELLTQIGVFGLVGLGWRWSRKRKTALVV